MSAIQVTVQLVISVATIIGSGVVSAIVTFRLNKQREERNLRREKLEQLLLSVDRYVVNLANHFMIYERCAEGVYDLNAANDLFIKQGVDELRPFETSRMLTAIYFPDLQPNLDEIIKLRDIGSVAVSEFKEGYKAGMCQNPIAVHGLKAINGKLCDAEDRFRAAAHGVARSLDD
jgi:hypothetical protein